MAAKAELYRISRQTNRSLSERLFWHAWKDRFLPVSVSRFGGFLYWSTPIGEGSRFVHQITGVHITRDARIGDRCTIMQNVTIGENMTSERHPGSPTIGDDVFIGSGAQIIGPCHIGDGAKIGAGVVLVNVNVPAGAVIVNGSAYDLTNGRFVHRRASGELAQQLSSG